MLHIGLIIAMAWAGHSPLQKQAGRELIRDYDFQGYERVLDVGCGDGIITAEIAQKLPDGLVIGLDRSEEMIAYCKERYDLDLFASLAFEKGDVASMEPRPDYELVVSNCALHRVEDQMGALTRIRKSLVPGGTFLALIPAKHNPISLAVQAVMSRPDLLYSRDQYRNLMIAAGFSNPRVNLITRRCKCSSREALADWIRQWLHEDVAIIDAVVEAYCQQNPNLAQRESVILSIDFLQIEATE